jgi:hypothetical protein
VQFNINILKMHQNTQRNCRYPRWRRLSLSPFAHKMRRREHERNFQSFKLFCTNSGPVFDGALLCSFEMAMVHPPSSFLLDYLGSFLFWMTWVFSLSGLFGPFPFLDYPGSNLFQSHSGQVQRNIFIIMVASSCYQRRWFEFVP